MEIGPSIQTKIFAAMTGTLALNVHVTRHAHLNKSNYEVSISLVIRGVETKLCFPSHSESQSAYKIGNQLNDCVNGVYTVVDDTGKVHFILKPAAEEAVQPSLVRSGHTPGDAVFKERAAFHLDHNRQAGVPPTELAYTSKGLCSVQKFMTNIGCSEDFSSSLYSTKDVQSIALFDVRFFNMDRHMGNMLVDSQHRLIPIDHGFTLPDYRNLSDAHFEWDSWKQAQEPILPALKHYAKQINILDDVRQLFELGIRQESVITYILCTLFLKIGIEKDWTLAKMASFMQRKSTEKHSAIELCRDVALTMSGFDGASYEWSDPQFIAFLRYFVAMCMLLQYGPSQ